MKKTCVALLLLLFGLLVSPALTRAEHDGKLQILLLGDSTTIGSVCRITDPKGPHLEDVIRLLMATEKDLPPVNVINQGRDGEYIQRLLADKRYDKEIARLPGIDYVLIRYGLNDIGRREDFDNNFPKDFHELIARLKADFPKAAIIPVTIIPYMTPEADARILNTALGAELEAIAAYQVGAESGLLQKPVLDLAVTFQGHHRQHADVLAKTVAKLGGKPVAAKAKYAFPVETLKTQADVLRFAATLEKGAVSAYLGAVPLFGDRDLAKAAASILGDEAMHWAILRNALGEAPVPDAFVS